MSPRAETILARWQGSDVLLRRPFLELGEDDLSIISLPSGRLGPAEKSEEACWETCNL